MKRLIVFTALLTLLASLSGCRILSGRRTKSCEAPPAVSSYQAPRFSLPWRRARAVPAGDSLGCNTCGDNGIVTNSVVSESMPTMVTEDLYDPGTVFDESPVYYERPVVEGVRVPQPELRAIP